MKIKKFLDEDVAIYAVYKVCQQIPGLMDNLSQTQRKIIHVMKNLPNKKVKTAELYTKIFNDTKYRHGDVSAYTTAENLAASYNNGISMLQPEGTFGYRTVKKASSPRYTSVLFGKAAQNVFNKLDYDICEKQTTEGKEIEPYSLLPIVPLGLFNGADGIGVGFSCKMYPRNPTEIIDIILKILTGKSKSIPGIIKPSFPFFKGIIENGDSASQFIVKGVFEKKLRNIIEIYELPISKNREKYIEFLNQLKDDKKIRSFTENCSKNKFFFSIKLDAEIYDKPNNYLEKMLSLSETISDSLLFLDRVEINEENDYEVIGFNNVSEFLHTWIIRRFAFYQKRKDYLIRELEYNIEVLMEKVRFIYSIIDEKLIINKKSKVEIIEQLEKLEFKQFGSLDDISSISYDYLLGMSIHNLCQDYLVKLEDKVQVAKEELEIVKQTEVSKIWISELKNLKKVISKEVNSKFK